ncbi:MAG: hypothetical protein ACT4P2_03545 [Pseudomonadota bacterium]
MPPAPAKPGRAQRSVLPALPVALLLASCALGPAPSEREQASLPAAGPPAAAAAAAPSALAALPPAGRVDEVERLLGQSPEAVRSALGPAAFVRRDGPAEIWRYAADDCFLDIFLYRTQGTIRVAHIEARPRGPGRTSAGACYGRLDAQRRALAPG